VDVASTSPGVTTAPPTRPHGPRGDPRSPPISAIAPVPAPQVRHGASGNRQPCKDQIENLSRMASLA